MERQGSEGGNGMKCAWTTHGKTRLFCCEAAIYLHMVGLPSAVLKPCDKCKGFSDSKQAIDPS